MIEHKVIQEYLSKYGKAWKEVKIPTEPLRSKEPAPTAIHIQTPVVSLNPSARGDTSSAAHTRKRKSMSRGM